MAPRLQEQLHGTLQAPLRGPNFDAMTDEEVMVHLSKDDNEDKYAVQHLAPDGMTYQWARCDVHGKSDYNRIAEVEQKGWQPVPQMRHDGRFMAPGTEGPTELDGQRLYELPSRVVRLKREIESRRAQAKVRDMNEQLIYSPPGTGPRGTHNYTAPVIRRESGSMPMVVE